LDVEFATVIYLIGTGLYILLFIPKIDLVFELISIHLVLVAVIFITAFYRTRKSRTPNGFILLAYPVLFLAFLYRETDSINNVFFQNLDSYLYHWESIIFHGQPSLLFHKMMPQIWFSELMNFGYFSFYLIIIVYLVFIFYRNREQAEKQTFLILVAFYLYYIIFIIFPTAGPQFYLSTSIKSSGDHGVFKALVHIAQRIGEGETGAFPSSHVGITSIILFQSYRFNKKLFWGLLPVGLLLFSSTVYIHAHYLIDVVAGILTFPLFLATSDLLYNLFHYSRVTQKKLYKKEDFSYRRL
jgi:membrane-associated phospholipid phosphatase